MKLKLVPLSLLPFFTVILTELTGVISTASAQQVPCIMTDISVQTVIRGSRRPATQTNNVQMSADKSCSGNTSTHTNTQTYVGSDDRVVQQRTSVHDLKGSGNNRGVKGSNGSNIAVPVQVQTDVYSPAHDPKFMNRVRSPR